MRVVETVMGIPMSVDIRDAVDGAAAAGAASAAFAVLREADERFSVYRPDSEVSAVNRGEHPSSAFSADLSAVIALGEEAERASGSAFRIRKPDGALDLDGVVKGWAAARAAEALRNHGMRRFCLNAGGDVVVGDAPDGAAAWNVGVRAPSDPDAILAVLAAENAAVATSGAYERGAHIVDGRTGAPAAGLLSATVVADDLTTADILATAVFALGRSGVDWAIGHGATGVLALTDGGELLVSGTIRFARAAA